MQDKNSVYVLGRKPLLEILKSHPQDIERVYLRNSIKLDSDIKLLLDSELSSEFISYVDAEKLDQITNSTQKNKNTKNENQAVRNQGVVTALKKKKEISFDDLINTSLSKNKFILALDQVQDPHNLGAILRVAESLGIDGVVKTKKHCADENTATVVKTSAGASYFLPVVTIANLANGLNKLKKKGYWIIGSSLEDRSIDISSLDANRPVVLVMGSEGKGIRQQTSQICDYLVKIPMQGKLQSLNVSTATSILVYEINRLTKAD